MLEDEFDPDFVTFPVRVQACRVDWILMSDVGINFLRALIKTPNISLFKTSYVQIVIQFLFSRYVNAVLSIQLPLYILHFASVFLMIIFNNQDRYIKFAKANENLDAFKHVDTKTNNAGYVATLF